MSQTPPPPLIPPPALTPRYLHPHGTVRLPIAIPIDHSTACSMASTYFPPPFAGQSIGDFGLGSLERERDR